MRSPKTENIEVNYSKLYINNMDKLPPELSNIRDKCELFRKAARAAIGLWCKKILAGNV